MGAFYGVYTSLPRRQFTENGHAEAYVGHLYPYSPRIDSVTWQRIVRYYLDRAPTRLDLPVASDSIPEVSGFTFTPVYPADADIAAYTTLIRYDSLHDLIVTGDPISGLRKFTTTHRPAENFPLPSAPSDLAERADRILVMGSLLPSDIPRGQLLTAAGAPVPGFPDSLARPVDFVDIDLDQDGRNETVIAEYGNMVGYLNSYRQTSSGTFASTTLAAQPGALRLRKTDLDQDGHDDLVVLFAQGDESVVAFLSRPGGSERKPLLRFPPSYGSSDLELADMDGDGDTDIVYTNGDNFDYEPIPKPYHGIRVFLNDGAADFSPAYFYPLPGAYDAEVGDFDGDGSRDIAVIAYFLPPELRRERGFLLLWQDDPAEDTLAFHPEFHRHAEDYHFLTLAGGDVDRDGDTDLLIGNFAAYLPDGTPKRRTLPSEVPVYIYVENTRR